MTFRVQIRSKAQITMDYIQQVVLIQLLSGESTTTPLNHKYQHKVKILQRFVMTLCSTFQICLRFLTVILLCMVKPMKH